MAFNVKGCPSSEPAESLLSATALSLVFALICCQPAHAYLDCGTGAFIAQMLLGGAMGMMVALTRFRKQVLGLFGRFTSKAQKEVKTEE